MTVYSKRSFAPTLPATAGPAETPMPASAPRNGRAEDAQRRVALELVDPAAVLLDELDDDAEEPVEECHHLGRRLPRGEPRGPGQVDEQRRHLTHLAAELDLAVVLERSARHVAAHVAAEEIVEALALAQPRGHPVEACLEQADLAAVVHRHRHVELAVLDPRNRPAHRRDGLRHRARGHADREHPHDHADWGPRRSPAPVASRYSSPAGERSEPARPLRAAPAPRRGWRACAARPPRSGGSARG